MSMKPVVREAADKASQSLRLLEDFSRPRVQDAAKTALAGRVPR